MDLEETSAIVIDTAFHIHCGLGPGLLESVYEEVLARLLRRQGLTVERQVMVKFEYDGLTFHEGLRIDLLVANCVIVELKSIEHLAPVHAKILLTYLRLMKMPLGLLINFGGATFKEGVKRVVNGHTDVASSRLALHERK